MSGHQSPEREPRTHLHRPKRGKVLVWLAAVTSAANWGVAAAQEETIVSADGGSAPSVAIVPAPAGPGSDTLTGDWGGGRSWLLDHGMTLKPRLTQFYQGMSSGEGDHSFEYGGKADVLFNADLSKLGFWNGFSMVVHAEYNFGQSANIRGGVYVPANTALYFPGIQGDQRYAVSSLYFVQRFNDSVSLQAGKINIIDLSAGKPFAGGAGIDSFWNMVFAAPPSGTVPAYLLGALLTVQTEPATFGLWIYDPNDMSNKTNYKFAFADGITFRGTVNFNVNIADLSGHQGLVALYSTKGGADLSQDDETALPPLSPEAPMKDHRYYFGYAFDQYLYQSKEDPKQGVGLFGQFGISDGNPNRQYWLFFVGVGGTGMIPNRARDSWGVGVYTLAPSTHLVSSIHVRNEPGTEAFYNFALTPWCDLGADLQIIKPGKASSTAVYPGLRAVIRF